MARTMAKAVSDEHERRFRRGGSRGLGVSDQEGNERGGDDGLKF